MAVGNTEAPGLQRAAAEQAENESGKLEDVRQGQKMEASPNNARSREA